MNGRNITAFDFDVTDSPCPGRESPLDFVSSSRDLVSCGGTKDNSSIHTNCSSALLSNCFNITASVIGPRYSYPDVRPVTIAIYLLTFVFGITGNSLVIYVIGKYEKIRVRSVSNYYIWNLAFADVLFVITLPFFCFATYANNWPFGSFVCKLLTVFRESNKFASVLTLVALSIDRFLATFHQFGRFRQIKNGIVACVLIWLLCLVISTPYWLFADVMTTKNQRHSCKILWPNLPNFSSGAFRRLWTYVQLTFGLLIPFAIIATFSVLLLRRVRRRSGTSKGSATSHQRPITGNSSATTESSNNQTANRLSRRNEANSSMTRVVLVIVVMFGICHLPYHVNEVVADWIIRNGLTNPLVISTLIYVNVIAQILVFIASCSNPIIYGVLNKNYRDLYKMSLCGCCSRSKTRPPINVTCVQSRSDFNGKSSSRRRRGTDFFPADTAPTVIVETTARGDIKNGKSDVVESRVFPDIHNTTENASLNSVSASGGVVAVINLAHTPDNLSGSA